MKKMYSIICIIISLRRAFCFENTPRTLAQSDPGRCMKKSEPIPIPKQIRNFKSNNKKHTGNFVLGSKTFPPTHNNVFNLSPEEHRISQLNYSSVHFQNPPKQDKN